MVTLNIVDRDKSDTETASEKEETTEAYQSEGAVGGIIETIQTQGAAVEEEYVVKVFGKNDPRPPLDELEGHGHTADEGQIVDEGQIEVEIESQQITEPSPTAGHRRHSKTKHKVSRILIFLIT